MKAFRLQTYAFDKKEHIVYAENANKAKWSLGRQIYMAGWGNSVFDAIRKCINSCKRAPELDT